MTKPQRYRWDHRMEKAGDAIDSARTYLTSTYEVCPEREPVKGESKDDECEALAATCVSEALVFLSAASGALGTAHVHLDWERDRAVRNFPLRARKLLEEIAAADGLWSAAVSELLKSTEPKS